MVTKAPTVLIYEVWFLDLKTEQEPSISMESTDRNQLRFRIFLKFFVAPEGGHGPFVESLLCCCLHPCAEASADAVWPDSSFISFLPTPVKSHAMFLTSVLIRLIFLLSLQGMWHHVCSFWQHWVFVAARGLRSSGKTTRPLRYDLNQFPYDYTVDVTNIFKGLDLIDRVPDEL